MFILVTEVIERIKERFVLIMIVNSDEKDSLVDKLNLIIIKLYIKLLSDHYFSDNELYDNSNYKNNINFRLCNYD